MKKNATETPKKKKGRKWWIVLLVIVFFVAAATISGNRQGTKVSDNPLMNLKVESETVTNGPGTETMGQRAEVKASKETFKSATDEQFKEFADSYDSEKYSWMSVIFDDGTGLVLNNTPAIEYGKLDDEGRITESVELYSLGEDGKYQALGE